MLLLVAAVFCFLAPAASAHEAHQSGGHAMASEPAAPETSHAPEAEGAHHADDETAAHANDETAAADEDEEEGESIAYRSVKFAGKFHPLAVHFPIALLLVAMLVQWYYVISRRDAARSVVAATLWFGALGALGAAALGWAYAYDTVYFGDDQTVLSWHRWLGTGAAVGSLVVLFLHRRLKPFAMAMVLTLLAALVGVTAHFGGTLLYGADYFTDF